MNHLWVLALSAAAGLSTLAGVYLVKFYADWTLRNSLSLVSFAGGVLLTTGFLELLPEAADKTGSWAGAALAGVIVLFAMEHFMAIHECQDVDCDIHTSGTVTAVGIGIHSLIDGFVIGAGFQAGLAIGVAAVAAVIVHEVPEGVFTYGLLIANKEPGRKAMAISWAVALATPVGTAITYFALNGQSPNVLGVMLAFAAGTFIYVGAADLLPQLHRRPNYFALSVMLAGMAFIIGLRYFFG
jgi:zinc transporter ZupT